jgi:D-threo-aldose 1-dehydrogenase
MKKEGSLALRTLGTTGLEVTPICFGASGLGNMPDTYQYSVEVDQALTTLRTIFASQVNFLDTAADYGKGESERRIGLVLKEMGGLPEGFVLASKADRDTDTGDFSGDQMRRSVERSLKLLGVEQIQLLYLHDPEYGNEAEIRGKGGAVEALVRCKEEGLIAHLGIAGGPIDMMTRFVEMDIFEAAISHNRFTLLNTEADPFWDVCVQHGVAAVNAAPYGSGILAKGPANYPRYKYNAAPPEMLERAFKIEAVCQRFNVPLAAAALQFSYRDPRVVSTIVGVTTTKYVNDTIALAEYAIPEELWEELAEI